MKPSLNIKTPLNDETLLLHEVNGHEGMSSLYTYQLVMSSRKETIDGKSLIGKSATINLELPDGKTREINGIIIHFSNAFSNKGMLFHATLVPSMWKLQQRVNCRIFQNKSPLDIISTILKEHSVDFKKDQVKSSPAKIEYCVQYEESDFNFVSRLMQHYGIFYYFEHSNDKHTLILADNTQAYIKADAALRLQKDSNHLIGISSWQSAHHFCHSQFTVNAHDFENPKKKLLSSTNAKSSNSKTEKYYFINRYNETNDGKNRSKIQMEKSEALSQQYTATSNDPLIQSGKKIQLSSNDFKFEKQHDFVVTYAEHCFSDGTIQNKDHSTIAQSQFICIPANVLFRSSEHFDKPPAPTIQLANVTGSKGSQTHTDKYGRLKVQFAWDREGKEDANSSCWIRTVSQHWEGILRVGTPVAIGFLDADINQPIVLGPVHNANLMPLYTPDSTPLTSGMKRRYTETSDEKAYNELKFNDKKDQQQMYFFASKDMKSTTVQDSAHEVQKGDYSLKVDKGKITIYAKGPISIKSDDSISFEAQKDIMLKATNITAKANSKLSQQAINIENKADANFKSQAAMHNIESDGITNIKGSLIKEN